MNEEQQNMPLSVILENTKAMIFESFNKVQQQTNLPAYLMEGIIVELLSQIRNQKNIELVADMNRMNKKEKEGEE